MSPTATGSSLEHRIGADGLVSVRVRDGDARLRAVDGDAVRVRDLRGRDLAELFAIDLGEGSISLNVARPTHGPDARGRRSASAVEIEVPRQATVVVEGSSADIDVDGLQGDQRYRTASGDVSLRAVGGRIAIESVSGDLDIIASGSAELSLRTVSGDVAVRAGTLRSLQAATTSGDLKVAGRMAGPGPFSIVSVSGDALLAPAGDVRIEMATLSGDLKSELDGRFESGRGRRSLTIGSNGPVVAFRSMSGDLKVVRPAAISHEAETPGAPSITSAVPSPVPDAQPAVVNGAIADAYDDARLRILRSLERGEIDVAEAGRRLEALDSGPGVLAGPTEASAPTDETTRA